MSLKNLQELRARIGAQWDARGRPKMDWLGLEDVLRDILRAYKEGDPGPGETQTSAGQALALVDEALAAWTKRGGVL